MNIQDKGIVKFKRINQNRFLILFFFKNNLSICLDFGI